MIFGFSHDRKPLQLLLFWSFAHGCSYKADGGKIGKNTVVTSAEVAGSWTGGIGGSKLGAMGGAAIGTAICPGLGTLVGGIVGGIVGGVGGSFVGKTAGGAAARAAYNIRR